MVQRGPSLYFRDPCGSYSFCNPVIHIIIVARVILGLSDLVVRIVIHSSVLGVLPEFWLKPASYAIALLWFEISSLLASSLPLDIFLIVQLFTGMLTTVSADTQALCTSVGTTYLKRGPYWPRPHTVLHGKVLFFSLAEAVLSEFTKICWPAFNRISL